MEKKFCVKDMAMEHKTNFKRLVGRVIGKYWFIVVFAVTLLIPIYGRKLDADITLSGVTAAADPVHMSFETLNNGTYQAFLNDVWEDGFPGKKFLLRVRNQFLYSFFKVSPNTNVVIGKDNYLYEPAYILFETQIYSPSSEEYFDTLGSHLAQLQGLLEENGKELYIFITPSKAHIYRDFIPVKYELLSAEGSYSYTNYSKLLEVLEANNLKFYDSVSFVEKNIETGTFESPVFYKSGIHWSHPWGYSAAAEFLDYMNSCSKYDLSSVSVSESVSDVPIAPDTDLYSSLNLIAEAKERWYCAESSIERLGNDRPNIFLRGGSFMGQSLITLVQRGIFGKDVHFENNYCFTDQYSAQFTLSSFSAYDEMDLDRLLGQSDILVLEVNEGAIYTMSWGFIDYLLEHPEYLDRVY